MSAGRVSSTGQSWLVGGGEMGRLIRSMDWAQTPLGPLETWPDSLRTTVNLALASNFPISIAWGPGRVQIYNDGYWPVCGGKHPQSMGQDFRTCWASAWPAIREAFEGASRGESAFLENQRMFLDRNGYLEETFFTFSFSPIRDATGAVVGLFHPVTEMTSQTLAERRLGVLRDISDATLDATSLDDAGVRLMATLEGHALDVPFALLYLVEDGGARLHRTAHLDPGGRAAPERIALDDVSSWPLGEAASSVRPLVVDGLSERFGPLDCGPYPEDPGQAMVLTIRSAGVEQPLGFLVVGVSPRRVLDDVYRTFYTMLEEALTNALVKAQAYEQERRRAEALAELDRAKTAFFSNVSHEFRTPLTLMLGPLESALAANHDLPAPLSEQLSIAHRNALRLLELVNSLLDFSRLEAGRMGASYEPTDLGSLTAELASHFRSACEAAGLGLTVDCPRSPESVYVDRQMWEKIVLNLLSNAFKFTLEGGIEVRVTHSSDEAVLEVRDTGVGVPRDALPRLFERFHRIEGSRGRTYEGSGIGLALVKELVDMHGGRIEADSAEGQGTTFRVIIPAGCEHLPADKIGAPAERGTARPRAQAYAEEARRWLFDDATDSGGDAGSEREPEAARETVLVVDDNADMRDHLLRLLEDRYDVRLACDGQDALDKLTEHRPDLVIADVMMPRLDGFALLEALRATPATSAIPVVLLSARAGEEARVEGLEAGADDYLVKPFSARELIARVQANLAMSVRRRAERAVDDKGAKLKLLSEAAEIIVSAIEPAEMMPRLFAQLRGHLEVDAYFNFRSQEPDRKLELVCCGGAPEDFVRSIETLDYGEAVCGSVALERRPIHATEIQTSDDPRTALVKALGIGVYVCYPLISEGELLGTLSFASRARDRFEDDELELFATISHYVTGAYVKLRLIQQLRQADRRKDEFLATLAHELRNPLAPIRTGLELLRMTDDRQKADKSIRIMERQMGQLTRLIDDLLDVSRITRGKLELRRRRVSVAEIVERAVEEVRPVIERSDHYLRVELPDEPVELDADEARMVQILSNLLSNAAKYTQPGGRIALTAELRSDGDGGEEVVLRVVDDGVGIPEEMLGRVFDMFTQVERTHERSFSGLGIGLTLVKSLAELHGGSVRVHSEGLDQGTEVAVILPRREPQGPTAPRCSPEVASGDEALRVLVVDDNHDAAELLGIAIEMQGNDVRVAHDGLEALEVADEFRPRVVVMDLGMPKMDGLEAARRLRLRDWAKEVTLVALTGWGQAADKHRTREAGFDFHLVKPAKPADVAALIASVDEER